MHKVKIIALIVAAIFIFSCQALQGTTEPVRQATEELIIPDTPIPPSDTPQPSETPPPTATPLPSDTPQPTATPTESQPPTPTELPCTCEGDTKNCGDFTFQREAQKCYDYCKSLGLGDIHELDGDDQDEVVCETLP